jgi:hypothetical protein
VVSRQGRSALGPRILAGDAGGTSLLISTPYDHLGSVGWSDRISSFKTLTSTGGTFYQHDLGTGWAYPFCCTGAVPYVGDAYNDQFSSVYPN